MFFSIRRIVNKLDYELFIIVWSTIYSTFRDISLTMNCSLLGPLCYCSFYPTYPEIMKFDYELFIVWSTFTVMALSFQRTVNIG